ncbi:MAG: hypothetical protein WD604_09780 [Balneolaceae bacterium]
MKKKYNRAIDFLKVGIQYLSIVELSSNKTYQQGNTNYYISSDPISAEKLEEETNWSDFNLVLPLLFNFYHGLEVLLKGFICLQENSIAKTHRLGELLAIFNKFYPNSKLIHLFEKYIHSEKLPSILADFCIKSSTTMDEFYLSLKYPEKNHKVAYNYNPLMFTGEKCKLSFKELRDDIQIFRQESVTLGRKEKPNT